MAEHPAGEVEVGERPWWAEHGYLAGRELGDGWWLAVAPMLFTFRVMVCTADWVAEHYCYTELGLALAAFERWDGRGPNPVDGWTRHHQ